MHTCARFLFCLALCAFNLPSYAQPTLDLSSGDNKNSGFPDHALVSGSDVDSVQMDSGNLHIEVPLWQVKGRAGLDFWVKLVYDSKGWTARTVIVPPVIGTPGIPQRTEYFITPSPSSNMQWAIRTPADYSTITQTTTITCGTQQIDFEGSDVTEEPNGSTHNLIPGPIQGNSCPGETFNYNPRYADDASGWMLAVNKEGTKVVASRLVQDWVSSPVDGSIKDRNGNTITFTASNSAHTDTLGRTVANDLNYVDANGHTQTIVISYINVPVSTNLCGNRTLSRPYFTCTEYSATWTLPHTVRLANGNAYTINYNQNDLGQPSSITTPSGATISYTWSSTVGNGLLDASGHRVNQRSVSANGTTNTWKYDYTQASQTVITDPLQNDTSYNCVNRSYSGQGLDYFTLSLCNPTDIKTFQGSYSGGVIKKEIQRAYWYSMIPQTTPVLGSDHLIASEITLLDGIPVSKTEYDYDTKQIGITSKTVTHISWGNIIEKREFNYLSGAWNLARRTSTTYKHLDDPTNYGTRNLASFPSSVTVYDGGTPGAVGLLTQNYTGGNIVAQTIYAYDNYNASPLQSTSSSPAPQHDYVNYSSSFSYRANVTSIQKMVSSGNFVTTQYAYDDLGNRLSETDARGNKTTYSYSDNWASSGCVMANTFAYLTQVSDALGHRFQSSYYPCSGTIQSRRDENDIDAGRAGTTYLYDLMGSQTNVTHPDGGSQATNYNGYAVPLTVTTTTTSTPDPNMISTLVYDQLGRAATFTAPSGAITTTTYDGDGRVNSVSNPHFSTPSSTDGTTGFGYDAIGRKLLQTQPDKSTQSWLYSGNTVIFTDEVGNKWKRISDGLGRLTQVLEPTATSQTPTLETDYAYDALNNLVGVNQKGASTEVPRVRSFTYDSLSRLICVSNPESSYASCPAAATAPLPKGVVSYGYDANGNLQSQMDARNMSFSYAYDALNRLVSKTPSANNSATFTYNYDEKTVSWNTFALSNTIGRLSSASSSLGGIYSRYSYSYDPMGRQVDKHFQLPSSTGLSVSPGVGTSGYLYDLAGNATFFDNGTGIYLYETRDSAGRVAAASSNKHTTGNLNNVSSFQLFANATYNPFGALASRTLGNGLTENRTYDNRGRLLSSSQFQADSPIRYNVSATYYANGSVQTSSDSVNGNWTYTYDYLNRLNGATSSAGLILGWTYDSFGNRWTQTASGTGSAPQPSFTFSGNTNRADASGGFLYDYSGNIIQDNLGQTYAYYADSRLGVAQGINGSTKYKYDSEGQLVFEAGPNGAQVYLRNENGQPTYNGNLKTGSGVVEAYVDGEQIGSWQPNIFFWSGKDWLDTKRYESAGTGDIGSTALPETPNSYTSLPFGDNLSSLGNDPVHFTGKERDVESGLDYFGARYYGSSMGRFMSPDWKSKPEPVPYASLDNPQTFNLYSYVGNNPLSKADPDGHCSSPSVGKGQVGICIDYYISTKTVDPHGMGSLGLGDNRGPMANDTEGRFRVEIKLVADRASGQVTGTSQAGMSKTSLGLSAPGKESSGLSASTDKDGNIHLDVATKAINGFQAIGAPGAPPGPIEGDVRLVVTPGNQVGTDAGGSRTAFPALEVYSYQPGKDPVQVLNMPQSSDSKDLTRGKTQQIPQVNPQ